VANFRDLIKRLAQRHTILLSTHILGEVEATCQRVVVVHRGRVVVEEPIDALRRRAARSTTIRMRVRADDLAPLQAALAACPWVQQLVQEHGSLQFDAPAEHRAELVVLAEAHGGLRELVEERLSLEAVFREITTAAAPVSPVSPVSPAA
jgi:ABC-2 type transport system ATP-binding protein